ncbi:MAG: OmpA family protein [Pseudomonadota bacterium]
MNTARTSLALVLAGALATACGIPEEQYVRKVNEVETLRQDLEGARGQVRAVDKKNKVLESALGDKDKSATDLARELGEAKQARSDVEANLAKRGRELAEMAAQLKQLEDERASLSKKQQKLLDEKRELELKTKDYDQLVAKMKDEIDSGKIEISNLRGRMAVKLKDKVLFASGSAKLQDEGKAALVKLTEVFKEITGKSLRVEGHTDNVPVSKSGKFTSNWDLSSARALAVVTFLQEQGLDATRLSAEGCGEYRPIADNETPEGRSQNRRIEIVLVPLAS